MATFQSSLNRYLSGLYLDSSLDNGHPLSVGCATRLMIECVIWFENWESVEADASLMMSFFPVPS